MAGFQVIIYGRFWVITEVSMQFWRALHCRRRLRPLRFPVAFPGKPVDGSVKMHVIIHLHIQNQCL